jgi:hypothetical protein
MVLLGNQAQSLETKHNHIEEHEDTKGIIRIRKSKKDRKHNGQMVKRKRTKGQTTICKKIHRKLKIKQPF